MKIYSKKRGIPEKEGDGGEVVLDTFQGDAAAWLATATSSKAAAELRATEEEEEGKEEKL